MDLYLTLEQYKEDEKRGYSRTIYCKTPHGGVKVVGQFF